MEEEEEGWVENREGGGGGNKLEELQPLSGSQRRGARKRKSSTGQELMSRERASGVVI